MFRKLRTHDGTPLIALDKDELEVDGVLEDGEAPDGKQMHVQRLSEGVYVVRDVSDGGIAELPESIPHR
ncbi:hypothetical protein [Haloferax larsenii]|uniref:DUF8053 domain-containing protein n=1 Tax=Haloferax larsenii TaxID=302484 RepID=A0A1H7KKZ8_HALLR|nr:hypothetical protein [Haloferax larsenii]SEK86675.1 hypothetical protein SAMN04488691_10218 [Haloferax larsenii]